MVIDNQKHEILQSSYEALLLSYAAGMLDEAQSLIVSSHVMLSQHARQFVKTCENVGGALIEKHCEPVPMKNCSLGKVLDKIRSPMAMATAEDCCTERSCNFPEPIEMPEPLSRAIRIQKRDLHWRNVLAGIQAMELDLQCKKNHSRFVKIAPGKATPHHRHGGVEITLVLGGAFSDQNGQYHRGDLIVTDERIEHTQQACPSQGCICFVVSTSPIRLTGIAALLNPFVRF